MIKTDRRELLVGAAALGAASIVGVALAAPVPKVVDVMIYGIKRSKLHSILEAVTAEEFEMVTCTRPRDAAAPTYDPQWVDDSRLLTLSLLWSAMQGVDRCERVGIEPLGFMLSDRAFDSLYTMLSRGHGMLTGGPEDGEVKYSLLGYPVTLSGDRRD